MGCKALIIFDLVLLLAGAGDLLLLWATELVVVQCWIS